MTKLLYAIAAASLMLGLGPLASASASPTVTISSPGAGSSINQSAPQIEGTTTDLVPTDSVTVELYKGAEPSGVPVQTLSSSPGGGNWSARAAPLLNGTYTAIAKQTQVGAGEPPGTSEAVTFTIAVPPPAVSISSPTPHATLRSSSRPIFSGTATGAAGPVAVTVELFTGESVDPDDRVQTLSAERNGSSWKTGSTRSGLKEGVYTVRASGRDSAGNIGQSPAVTFTVATPTAPKVTLAALPRWTNNSTPVFSGTADPEGTPKVTLSIWSGTEASGKALEVTVPTSGGTWMAAITKALPQGPYIAQARQSSEGSPEGFSNLTPFTVDTVAPAVTLAGPSTSSGLETVSGAAGTAPGDRGQVTVELFLGARVEPGNAVESITVNATGSAWTATFAGLGTGQYTALARQSDEAGNVGASEPRSFSVTASTAAAPSPSPPVASFTWVPAIPTVGQIVSLVSSSTDPSSAIGAFAWDRTGTGQFAPGGPVVTTSFATVGAHVVQLRVSDGNGLTSTVAHTIVVAAARPPLMQPFPIVRIAGTETSYGVRIKLLTVQAPLGAKVQVACVGRACKMRPESRLATASSNAKTPTGAVTLAFKRFERSLRSGVTLQIRVTKEGEIGKYTSFAIRRNKLPVRGDACLAPTSTKPSPCPSS